jgi:hypothetical protein
MATISKKAIQEAVKASGINTPYWTRVVGDRLEIQPLGGKVLVFYGSRPQPGDPPPFTESLPAPDQPTITLTPAELRAMKRDDLRAMAREKEIDGAGTMLKAELVNAICAAEAKP